MTQAAGADIQIENGNFLRVHNHILEALSQIRITAAEHAVIQFLLRQTYGYRRTKARISYNEFERYLPYGRRGIVKAIYHLEECNIIRAQSNGDRESRTYSFNKYHEEWLIDGEHSELKFNIPALGGMGEPIEPQFNREPEFNSPIEPQCNTPIEPQCNTLKDNEKDNEKDSSANSNNSGGSCETQNDGFKEVTRFYETNIGTLTEYTKQELETLVSEYGSADIVVDAMRVAVQANKKSLRYTHGILRNWHADGKNGNKAPALLSQATLPSTLPASVFDV